MERTMWLMILWSLVSVFTIGELCIKTGASLWNAMLIGGLVGALTFVSYIMGMLAEKIKNEYNFKGR